MRKRAVRAKKKVTEVEVEENVEKTPLEIITELLEEVKVTDEKEKAGLLLGLKNPKGQTLIDVNNKDEIFEMMTRISKFGFDGFYEGISKGEYISLQHYFFNHMDEQKRVYVIKTLQKNLKNKAVEGLFECPRCKKEGRKPNNTRSITHYYRADEPGISKVTCLTCGHAWKDK